MMGQVTVKIRINDSSLGIIGRSAPLRVQAEYVGRYKNAIVCIRENSNKDGFISFDVGTGKIIKSGKDKEKLIAETFELIKSKYEELSKLIKRLTPLYGIICFAIQGNEILGNTLIDPKIYKLCMKRTNGRYKEIADKVFSK